MSMSIKTVKLPPKNVVSLKQQSCQVSCHLENSSRLCDLWGRKPLTTVFVENNIGDTSMRKFNVSLSYSWDENLRKPSSHNKKTFYSHISKKFATELLLEKPQNKREFFFGSFSYCLISGFSLSRSREVCMRERSCLACLARGSRSLSLEKNCSKPP